ncbi:MAG: alpha/beta hydrolase [Clostridia bacterium]|nr:alpha/beta hydrolase [Clostridia bacterium]
MSHTVLSEVSFIQKGTGKDLLLLHGYLSSKEAFAAQVAYFSKFYRVTALDFLGFGQSAPLKSAFSVEEYSRWLLSAMHVLGVRKPHVIAHSFGCRVAIKTAANVPDAFDKMVLTGPAGVILKRGFRYKCKVATYRFVKKFAPRFAEKRFGSKEYRSLSPIMKESYKKIVNEDLRECAKRVQNRVLIAQGTRDKTVSLAEAQAYFDAFSWAKMKKIEGGHFAFAENPIAFNLMVEEFLYG